MLERHEIEAQADRLHKAWESGEPLPPLTDEFPGLAADDAYAIQRAFVARFAGGNRVVGYKLGLTSKPMQDLLGVDQPDYGPILESMMIVGDEVDTAGLIAPKIEAELALHLHRDLSGPGCTPEDVSAAVAGVSVAVEIIDSRIRDWKIRLADTVADLASARAVVLSPTVVPLDEVDPRLVGVVVTRNGELAATGAGAAALGDPLAAVAWLANTLAHHGERLEPGRFVMTGALHAAFHFAAGDVISVETDRLGALTVHTI